MASRDRESKELIMLGWIHVGSCVLLVECVGKRTVRMTDDDLPENASPSGTPVHCPAPLSKRTLARSSLLRVVNSQPVQGRHAIERCPPSLDTLSSSSPTSSAEIRRKARVCRSNYRKRLLGAAGVSPNSEEGAVAVQFRSALVSTTTKTAATMATFVSFVLQPCQATPHSCGLGLAHI